MIFTVLSLLACWDPAAVVKESILFISLPRFHLRSLLVLRESMNLFLTKLFLEKNVSDV